VYMQRKPLCVMVRACVVITVSIAPVWGIGSGVGQNPSQRTTKQAINEAIRTPFIAFANRDARALCDAFTQSAASHLAYSQPGATCERRVVSAFSTARLINERLVRSVAKAVESVQMVLKTDIAWIHVRLGRHGSMFVLFLRRIAGKWRIATAPVLALTRGCTRDGSHCPRIAIFGFAEHVMTR
jgi:hypothetical protein